MTVKTDKLVIVQFCTLFIWVSCCKHGRSDKSTAAAAVVTTATTAPATALPPPRLHRCLGVEVSSSLEIMADRPGPRKNLGIRAAGFYRSDALVVAKPTVSKH